MGGIDSVPLGRATTGVESCLFCGQTNLVDDALRRTVSFENLIRRYTRCRSCGSRSLSPMPHESELAALYTTEYFEGAEQDEPELEDPNAFRWVADNLPGPQHGLFIDLGCGDGGLLRLIADLGYEVLGLEINETAVMAAELASGCPVVIIDELPSFANQAGAVHLGDVLEHASSPEAVVRSALTLLRPGGLLLAQGPLEANRSVFNFVLALVAVIRKSVPVSRPPYHVHLVSPRGQEQFFHRLGLETLEYQLSNVSWPAPAQFDSSLLKDPRRLALYAAQRISSVVRPLAPRLLSNRFKYIGRPFTQ